MLERTTQIITLIIFGGGTLVGVLWALGWAAKNVILWGLGG